jgi:heterodisulfide reductase subunit A
MNQGVAITKSVLILGGAPEAEIVQQELLALGYQVHWAPLEERAFALETLNVPGLAVYPGAELVGLEGHVGHFTAHLEHGSERFTVSAAAIVVATGNERYYPAERYRVALAPRVLTVPQIRQQLDVPRSTRAALPHRHERIMFLLDWGGETAKETATEALQVALRLRQEWHCEVCVFYRDLKVDTYNLERLTREMRDRGVVFCRYNDPQVTADDEGVNLTSTEGTLRGEMLILPEAVRPRANTAELAALLRVNVGEDGYFQDVNIRHYRPGISNRKGILFAGRCHLEADEATLLADAYQAAANVDALLGAGFLAPEEIVAQVDSSKCIRCLTCIRTCPHAAVELAEEQDVVAAKVVELACQGCGACVANCPVRAITLVGQWMPAWVQGS